MRYVRPSKRTFDPHVEYVACPLSDATGLGYCEVAFTPVDSPAPITIKLSSAKDTCNDFFLSHDRNGQKNQFRFLVWGHGIATLLDRIGLREMVDCKGWKIDFLIDLDPPGICIISKGRVKVAFWDIRNWLNMSVKELMYKMPEEEQLAGDNWDTSHICTFREYITLHSLHYAVRRIRGVLEECKWGKPRPTVASQSFAIYCHNYPLRNGPLGWQGMREWQPTWSGKDKVYPLVHGDNDLLDAERSTLFGGVVSCFRPGELHTDVDVWDCNSLYAYLGQTRLFPVKWLGSLHTESDIKRALRDESLTGFALVEIDSKEYPFPVLSGDKSRYVRGSFMTYLTWPELIVAERERAIVRYHGGMAYAAEKLLGKFSEQMLRRKSAYQHLGDKLSTSIVKRLVNGCWGKFGQRNDKWVKRPQMEAFNPWSMWAGIDGDTREVVLYRALGEEVWERSGSYYPNHASPIVSAVMCGHARVFMTEIIKQLDPRTVLYSATDSLHLTRFGSNKLTRLGVTHDTEPGKFSCREALTNVRYVRPGWYTSDEKTVHSGVPIEAEVDDKGRLRFQRGEGLRALLSTPTLTHLRSRDVTITPPVAMRRLRRIPRAFGELWQSYKQRKAPTIRE